MKDFLMDFNNVFFEHVPLLTISLINSRVLDYIYNIPIDDVYKPEFKNSHFVQQCLHIRTHTKFKIFTDSSYNLNNSDYLMGEGWITYDIQPLPTFFSFAFSTRAKLAII